MMRLSKRLLKVAEQVQECRCVCDVGTDHGYLPIYLVGEGICETAYALDVREGPLSRAREHIEEAGLSDRITALLSDGLDAVMPGAGAPYTESGRKILTPDVIVIAGMGGLLMQDILTRGREAVYGSQSLVLSPQSHIREFRELLYRDGYHIADEHIVYEDRKYYFIINAVPPVMSHRRPRSGVAGETRGIPAGGDEATRDIADEAAVRYGAPLLARRDPMLLEYLGEERARLSAVREQLKSSRDAARLFEIEKELSIIEATGLI